MITVFRSREERSGVELCQYKPIALYNISTPLYRTGICELDKNSYKIEKQCDAAEQGSGGEKKKTRCSLKLPTFRVNSLLRTVHYFVPHYLTCMIGQTQSTTALRYLTLRQWTGSLNMVQKLQIL